MAVARITSKKSYHRALAEKARELGLLRAERELLRAVDRPGLTAELAADEVRKLQAYVPSDEQLRLALMEINDSEARDRERTTRVRRMMDTHRDRL